MSREPREAPSALIEAAAIILANAGRSLGITVLNKALFKLDLVALLETGKQATGATYVALEKGPVVESYKRELVGELERLAIAMQDDADDDYGGAPVGKPVHLLHNVKPKFLDAEVLKLAKEVGAWSKDQNATKVTDFFHKNPGWISAWNDGAGQGAEINMHLAMQQLLDEDPWMKQPATEEEKKVLAVPDPVW